MKVALTLPVLLMCVLFTQISLTNQNYLVNGDFSNTTCNTNVCLYNNNSYTGQITGWTPSPQVEIGTGNIYSGLLNDKQRVIQLDAYANSCIIQIIPKMPVGEVRIHANYIARSGTELTSCGLKIYFNGGLLAQVIPSDYNISQKVVTSKLLAEKSNVEVKFCGSGKSDGSGPILIKVYVQSDAVMPRSLTTSDLAGIYWQFGSEYSWHGMMLFGVDGKVYNYNEGGIAYWQINAQACLQLHDSKRVSIMRFVQGFQDKNGKWQMQAKVKGYSYYLRY